MSPNLDCLLKKGKSWIELLPRRQPLLLTDRLEAKVAGKFEPDACLAIRNLPPAKDRHEGPCNLRLRLVTSSIGGILAYESNPKTINIEVFVHALTVGIVRQLHRFSSRGSNNNYATTRFC
jgi:hypothetical protein